MKKGNRLTAILLSGCMTALMMPMLPAPVSADVLRGDVNFDGRLTADDVFQMRDYLMDAEMPVHEGLDYNGDGVFNAKDLSLLKRYILEKPEEPETAVLMVYLCGSDLETEAAEATEDLYEMLDADYSSGNLTIVAMTGGAKQWHDPAITADQNYYVTINSEGGYSDPVDGTLRYMSNPDTLELFIRETAQAYPADHYGLIMWDHGSGPIFGLCYDELSDSTLYLKDMCSALKNAGVHFDWIGFDCCLMGNAETAFALRDYADYMIGSEESESGYGWYYKNFPTRWAEQPDMPATDLAKLIIDDMTSVNKHYRQVSTLACYDLSKAAALMDSVYAYMDEVYQVFQDRGVLYVNAQRENCLDFGDDEFDLVDIASLTKTIQTAHSEDVQRAVRDMVIYNRYANIAETCGISLWFFEKYPEDGYYLMDEMLGAVGIDREYIRKMVAMSKVALEIKTGYSAWETHARTWQEVVAAMQAMRKPAA